jgi:acyltransferase
MQRISYLDRAKAIGMFLVFYSHFVEKLTFGVMDSAAALQWKLLYSFHMPLFFFLSGIFWRPDPGYNWRVAAGKFKLRIIPVIIFEIISISLWLWFDPRFVVPRKISAYLTGYPFANTVTWFLVCLFVLEIMAGILGRFVPLDKWKSIAFSILSFFGGLLILVRYRDFIRHLTGINVYFWFFNVAVAALSFYLMGFAFRSFFASLEKRGMWKAAIVLFATATVVLFGTYDLNQGPFVEGELPGVLMVASSFGNPFWFGVTAYAGLLSVLALARMIDIKWPPLDFVGRNTIIYLGISGICLNFIDSSVISMLNIRPATMMELVSYSTIYCVVVMSLFAPVVFGLRRWFPEFFGGRWTDTSLLPPMSKWPGILAGHKSEPTSGQ